MAHWRNEELEALLGGPLDETGLVETALMQLVHIGARESDVLDFKDKSYPPAPATAPVAWSQEQEFAKDVSAFANHRGGLLLIGVSETNDVASALSPCIADPVTEERRLRQALANYAAPIPLVAFVPIGVASASYCLAVVVPPSPRAPHAVRGAPGDSRRPLYFPVRDGADSRWMLEAEIADRYRLRARTADQQAARLDRVIRDGTATVRRAEGLWVAAAVTPESPMSAELTRRDVDEIREWWDKVYLFSSPLGGSLAGGWHRPMPAPGRVVFNQSGVRDDDPVDTPTSGYVELYADGSAFVATPTGRDTDGTGVVIGDLTVADDTIQLVDACLSWCSSRAGAWGTASFTIFVIDTRSESGLAEPVPLVSHHFGRLRPVSGTRSAREAPTASIAVDLTDVERVQDRLRYTHAALSGLLQWFGMAEPDQIDEDGALIASGWGNDDRRIQLWTSQHGVEMRRHRAG
jgi:hypothetical protein